MYMEILLDFWSPLYASRELSPLKGLEKTFNESKSVFAKPFYNSVRKKIHESRPKLKTPQQSAVFLICWTFSRTSPTTIRPQAVSERLAAIYM